MNHASLFSGIGGFDLAAEWMDWNNIFHCEWNPFGQRVLKYYWPNAESYGDITKTDFSKWRGRIDILTGGFPCQPYSLAGKRLGKEDERHLWPEMLRAIREIQPRWVVGENVLGIVNWNEGLVFDEVQADLEAQGYEVQPYVLPACGVNAPHKRERVWFVARHTDSIKLDTLGEIQRWENAKPGRIREDASSYRNDRDGEKVGFQARGKIHVDGATGGRIDSDTRLQRQAERQKQAMGIEQLCEKKNATDTDREGLQGDGQYREHEKEYSQRGTGTHEPTAKFYRG